jgi:hypothetical protein
MDAPFVRAPELERLELYIQSKGQNGPVVSTTFVPSRQEHWLLRRRFHGKSEPVAVVSYGRGVECSKSGCTVKCGSAGGREDGGGRLQTGRRDQHWRVDRKLSVPRREQKEGPRMQGRGGKCKKRVEDDA